MLKDFESWFSGQPLAGLTFSGGRLYGTTELGGSFNEGTVFAIDLRIPLNCEVRDNALILSWSDPACALQAAPQVTGSYTNIPSATSPHTNALTGPQRFFRLLAP